MNDKKNRSIKNRRWLLLVGGIILLIGLWQLLTSLYMEEEKELRSRIRETVKENFPEETAALSRTFGIFKYTTDREKPDEIDSDRKSVVMVHGLDDPGHVWQNLAPVLAKEGFDVWQLHYPNDQPVVESARLFFDSLKGLKDIGILRISLVAHSMGGLVAREMLTSPAIAYSESSKKGLVPGVDMLIMVGTPNHGSQMARFRVFTEIRDHMVRLAKGETNWLGAILDGAGEAKIDLLPGSLFLTGLNARPHPDGVDMLIIAGITSPWTEDDIKRWLRNVRKEVSADEQKMVDELGRDMIKMTHALGDGLVTVESTRLDGVPHLTVEGTHLSMIRNLTADSERIPPAVPIILNRLKGQ